MIAEGIFMQRKAQMSQVFTYIIVILVVGVLVVFGYKAFNDIVTTNCEAQRATFERNIIAFLDEYTDKDSVQEETLRAPCGVKQVCFVDYRYCDGVSSAPILPAEAKSDPVVQSSVNDCTANIFLMGEFTETFKFSEKLSDKISLNDTNPYDCFKVTNGRVNIVFVGQGRRTLLEHS
jgi:hypothetical protein